MRRPLIYFTVLAMMASLLTGCTVGPKYRKPAVPVPPAYHGPNDNPPDQAQAQAASFADLPWWQVFQDSVLQDLIRRALKQNYDLQTATEKITQARAQLIVTPSNQDPHLSASEKAVDERTVQGS